MEIIRPAKSWIIRKANAIAIGKTYDESKPDLTLDQWVNILQTGDSTNEWVDFYIFDDMTSGTVASHIVRGTKFHPRFVVQTKRPDLTGEPRPSQETPRMFYVKANPYALREMGHDRLCNLALKSTREWVQKVKETLEKSDDPFDKAVASIMVPQCVYRGRCYKGKRSCGMCNVKRAL